MKDKKKIMDILLEFYEEYQGNIPNRPMIPSIYASKIIDSLQEEPVSDDEIEKQFKAGDVVVYVSRQPVYSGLYLLGNPNDLSIGYSNANEPYQIALRNCTVASEDERKQFMRELYSNGYKWNEDTLRIEKEELVSDDLGEYINELSKQFPEVSFAKLSRIAVRVAKWQKQQDHAMLAGMEKMKEQMMAEAIDVEVKVDAGGYPYIDATIELYDYDKDEPLARAGDKVKLIVLRHDE